MGLPVKFSLQNLLPSRETLGRIYCSLEFCTFAVVVVDLLTASMAMSEHVLKIRNPKKTILGD